MDSNVLQTLITRYAPHAVAMEVRDIMISEAHIKQESREIRQRTRALLERETPLKRIGAIEGTDAVLAGYQVQAVD